MPRFLPFLFALLVLAACDDTTTPPADADGEDGDARLGPDVREWRWDRVVSDRRYFPVWSADSLVNASLQDLHTTRYAPLRRTGHGHPSALVGGPFFLWLLLRQRTQWAI